MFLSSDARGDNIVTATPFGVIYSEDGGKTYSSGDTWTGGQSVCFSESKVWTTTSKGAQNSIDGGKTWEENNIDALKTQSRYLHAISD